MKGSNTSAQAADRTARLLKQLDRVEKHAIPLLARKLGYSDRDVTAILAEIRRELVRLAPEVPYIGGKQNRHTWNLEGSALFLAAYHVLKRRGRPVEEIGRLFYDLMDNWYQSYPPLVLRLLGLWTFTPFYRRGLQRAAARSQQRCYTGDFVYRVVSGRGRDYDFGVDFTECGICKFYRSQDALEILPYLCLLDYPIGRAMGLGLRRTATLAEGAVRCDFRFKRGRPAEPGWPPRFGLARYAPAAPETTPPPPEG